MSTLVTTEAVAVEPGGRALPTHAPAGVGLPFVDRIALARARTTLVTSGTVRAVATVAIGSGLAAEYIIGDDSGDIVVLFLGRRTVAGFEVGTRSALEGTVLEAHGRLQVWNPRYRLLAP